MGTPSQVSNLSGKKTNWKNLARSPLGRKHRVYKPRILLMCRVKHCLPVVSLERRARERDLLLIFSSENPWMIGTTEKGSAKQEQQVLFGL